MITCLLRHSIRGALTLVLATVLPAFANADQACVKELLQNSAFHDRYDGDAYDIEGLIAQNDLTMSSDKTDELCAALRRLMSRELFQLTGLKFYEITVGNSEEVRASLTRDLRYLGPSSNTFQLFSKIPDGYPETLGANWLPQAVRPSGEPPRIARNNLQVPLDDSREVIVIDQNFEIPAGDTIIFKDKILEIESSSTAPKDINIHGALKIIGSTIFWKDKPHMRGLSVKNGGVLEIEDSYGISNQGWGAWTLESGATMSLDRFHANVWVTARGDNINYSSKNYSWSQVIIEKNVTSSTFYLERAIYSQIKAIVPKLSGAVYDAFVSNRIVSGTISGFHPDTIILAEDSRLNQIDFLTIGTLD